MIPCLFYERLSVLRQELTSRCGATCAPETVVRGLATVGRYVSICLTFEALGDAELGVVVFSYVEGEIADQSFPDDLVGHLLICDPQH